MTAKVMDLKVVEIDQATAMATLIDLNETDDVVRYHLYLPAHFGGSRNPWPTAGQAVAIRYEMRMGELFILECWRSHEETAT